MSPPSAPPSGRPARRFQLAFRPGRAIPALGWIRRYNGATFTEDVLAGVIVTAMLIPQSLAYAMIAGLPPETGLYASILPLVAYALFGTSNTLAVGPVAVVSLLTATAVARHGSAGAAEYALIAMSLACVTGLVFCLMGVLRLGFLANFLSHPIIAGFIAAAGVLIAAGQLKHLLGVSAHGETLIEIVTSLVSHLPATNSVTLVIGSTSLLVLFVTRRFAQAGLRALGLGVRMSALMARAAPLLAVILATAVVAGLRLDLKGVAIVGAIPGGLPRLTLAGFDPALMRTLIGSGVLIAVIGYVESVSIAQTLAAKRREKIDLDQELFGLGASNLAAGVSGGFPVTGGFARSVVNYDAGARTPAAGLVAALGIAATAAFASGLLYYLPLATLAATIIIAVLSLIDLKTFRSTLRYSKSEFAAMATTVLGVFVFGVETGVLAGVVLSITTLLYKASRPHSAVVGQIPGAAHFRNVDRHTVITSPRVVSLRIDGNLFFANARAVEQRIHSVASKPDVQHVILMCSAINGIDTSALHALEAVNESLAATGVKLHLSEVKGPVMDRLKRTDFLLKLTGRVFLSHFDAARALDPDTFKIEPLAVVPEPLEPAK